MNKATYNNKVIALEKISIEKPLHEGGLLENQVKEIEFYALDSRIKILKCLSVMGNTDKKASRHMSELK